MYIGNPDYELTLVRSFDIAKGKYYGFENIYSRHDVVQKNENIENAITDSRLLKIIKSKEKASQKNGQKTENNRILESKH